MLKKLFVITTMVAALAACKGKSKDAYNYSNDIVAKERKLQPLVMEVENEVKKFYSEGNYSGIASAGEKMEGDVQKTIDEINAMPVPKAKEADNFKTAVIRYFSFIKRLYTRYKDFGRAETEEKRQEVLGDIQKIVEGKQEQLDDMQKAQRKFAEVNGFKLDTKK